MHFFSKDALRRVYLKPIDDRGNNSVQCIKISKSLYWQAANLLTANDDLDNQTYLYRIIRMEAIFAKESMSRVAKSMFSELLKYPDSVLRVESMNDWPLLTPKRKREIAMSQQMLSSEFAMQGGEKPFVRLYDAEKVKLDIPDQYF